jgi:hypothetical protein
MRRELDGKCCAVRPAAEQVAIFANVGDLEAADPAAVEMGAHLDFSSLPRFITGIPNHPWYPPS